MAARFLLVTAAFGEGHNSAASNLALALRELGAEARIEDPCLLGAPVSTQLLCRAYRGVTTYAPGLWNQVYRSTGKVDFSRQRLPLMRKPERCLAGIIEEFQPDAVVSTYPLYPYFLDRILEGRERRPRIDTVVTDSIEINSAWLDAPSDRWLVTDPFTREAMIRHGLPGDRVIDTGFCVHPSFSRQAPIADTASIDPFRVLYFPTPKRPHVRRISKAVLKTIPGSTITIVLGKNVRLLHSKAREIHERFPGRVKILGWTKRVPQLLARHHLVLGKAGGATVHEAIAATCPMIVHHLVPGQEEGNLRLLERIGGGAIAEEPDKIAATLTDLLADHGAGWRRMKRALRSHGRDAGAIAAARFLLDDLARPSP